MVLEIFSTKVRQARDEMGLVQADFAGLLGLRVGQVVKYEAGYCLPKPAMLDKLASVTGHPPSWFFEPSGSKVVRAIGRPKDAARSTEVALAGESKARRSAVRGSARTKKPRRRSSQTGNTVMCRMAS